MSFWQTTSYNPQNWREFPWYTNQHDRTESSGFVHYAGWGGGFCWEFSRWLLGVLIVQLNWNSSKYTFFWKLKQQSEVRIIYIRIMVGSVSRRGLLMWIFHQQPEKQCHIHPRFGGRWCRCEQWNPSWALPRGVVVFGGFISWRGSEK